MEEEKCEVEKLKPIKKYFSRIKRNKKVKLAC